MAKLVPPKCPPLPEPHRPVLDLTWSFSLGRTPGSDQLATRMTRAALDTLGVDGRHCARIAQATALACAHVLLHASARRYRVALAVDGPRCSVTVTDHGFDRPAAAVPAPGPREALQAPGSRDPFGELSRSLCGMVDGMRLDGAQIHHSPDGAVLVRFRAHLPEPTPGTAHAVPEQLTRPAPPAARE